MLVRRKHAFVDVAWGFKVEVSSLNGFEISFVLAFDYGPKNHALHCLQLWALWACVSQTVPNKELLKLRVPSNAAGDTA